MAKNENTIWVILGIVAFIIIASRLPFAGRFAITKSIVCTDFTISSWDFDGTVLDANNFNNGVNNGGEFVSGKLGQAIYLNGTSYIDFPALGSDNLIMWVKDVGDTNYFFLARIGGVNYLDGAVNSGTSRLVIPIGPQFGLGRNVTIDGMAIFSNLSVQTMMTLYNAGAGRDICYATTTYENVTCKEYTLSKFPDTGYGCVTYSGDFFPNCSYQFNSNQSSYSLTNNACIRNYFCEDGDYSTYASCAENIQNVSISTSTPSGVITETTTSSEQKSLGELATKEIFNIFGISITAVHLIILLILILGAIYLLGGFKGGR